MLEQLGVGAFCNVCQIVITYFDNELLKNETLAELGDVLEKGCEMLPTPLTDKVTLGRGWGGERPAWRGPPDPPCTGLTPSLLPSARRWWCSTSRRPSGSWCR